MDKGLVMRWQLRTRLPYTIISKLQRPLGIHVDAQRNVYVAECRGNQISKWPSGKRVAGTGRSGNMLTALECPSAVVVDSDGRMFIADTENHRLVRWEPNAPEGICIVGCQRTHGRGADQLYEPKDVTFDFKGNLLVADARNNRIQRFDLFLDPQCGKY